jgi:hypothetical protein
MTTTAMSPKNRYAADTEVPVERSKRVIELLLQQRGAEQYHTGWDSVRDIIEFGWNGKQIRFVLPRPNRSAYELSPGGVQRSRAQIDNAMLKADRQRWRALYLVVRAKLEAVEAGIAVFEEEFMAFIVVPGKNQTVGEILLPRLAEGRFDISRALPEAEEKRR